MAYVVDQWSLIKPLLLVITREIVSSYPPIMGINKMIWFVIMSFQLEDKYTYPVNYAYK